MPKTSSQCLTNLLCDDGMKVEELFARASVDETTENVRKESTRLSSYAMQHAKKCIKRNTDSRFLMHMSE